MHSLSIVLGSLLCPNFQVFFPGDLKHTRCILVLFYKMLINRIFLRSRTGANPLPCETADTSTEYIYDVSKLVGMGKTPVFSSLRLAFLVKPVPPSHPPKGRCRPVAFYFFLHPSLSGNAVAPLHLGYSLHKLCLAARDVLLG